MYELVIDTKSISIDKKYWYCDKKVSRTKVSRKSKRGRSRGRKVLVFSASFAPCFPPLRETFISWKSS